MSAGTVFPFEDLERANREQSSGVALMLDVPVDFEEMPKEAAPKASDRGVTVIEPDDDVRW